ncbi:hypothetical protein FCE95_10030 [Luteimonas gilva]|uniref:MobA/VirD2-like nuclease domain-containing protein n=1 Tax=Luteimonas gilva TaxID=2572684 RepID=A0A4U5JLD7_9GAMM|nr:relaxase/mobilization nuclease domain-containing protein [Luteimonas gilva]TKR30450.1 hypothetical protein FCE95_10030 [Luteimonas gilva]
MTMIDDALKEWDENYHFKPLRGRKAKLTITGVRVPTTTSQPRRTSGVAGARSRLSGIVRKVPEVMVKVSGGGKGMRAIKAHMDYISRNGDVALENENGEVIAGKEAVRDLRDEWKNSLYGIPEESGKKEAFNIVLSMPPGTDRKAVTDAAREFAKTEFSGNFQYVFATHDDEKHPHVHLCVKAQGIDGTRLNPRKADLQRWREGFAEALREHGIEANATPRLVRGARRRTRRQAALHVDASQRRSQGDEHTPKASQKVVKGYESLAKALAQGEPDDRSLALGIVNTVKGMKAQQGTDIQPTKNEPREVTRDGQEAHRTVPDKKQSPER